MKERVKGNASFEKLTQLFTVPSQILRARIHFLVTIAKPLSKFLTDFQTDKPFLPFLADDLESLFKCLLGRFLKSNVDNMSLSQLSRVEINPATVVAREEVRY